MRFLIVGSGVEEDAWAAALGAIEGHELAARVAPSDDPAGLAALEGALTDRGIEAVILGGPHDLRAEALRRVAILGLPTICLHPPGDTADAYYQVALAHTEAPPMVVPDMPLRLHPAIERMAELVPRSERRHVSLDVTVAPGAALLSDVLPRVIDLLWSLAGPIESLMASASPASGAEMRGLTLHMESAGRLSSELRLRADARSPAGGRLVITSGETNLTWTFPLALDHPTRLTREPDGTTVCEFPPFDSRRALLEALEKTATESAAPLGLGEAIRAMELTEGAARSLKRGRTIGMHYDEISELSSFKANMTSVGCGLVIASVLLYVVSRIGLAFGIEAAGYLAWAIFGLLSLYAVLQLLRYAARPSRSAGPRPAAADRASPQD